MKSPVASLVLAMALAAAVCAPLAAGESAENDYGHVSFANSGSVSAQEPFLRGLAELHDFEFASAADDFRKAEKIDPNFAMAYWGEAMTYNHAVWYQQDTAAGRAALNKLAPTPEGRLSKCGTERERDYMRAVDILYNGKGDKNQRDFEYSDAMAALYKKYPDDVNAGAFYALSLLGTAHHGRDFSIYMRALAVLEPLFWKHPDNPGVDHYLIHSVDDPIHAPLGLAAALNYSKIALKAAHAQHMTSHIFLAMGMWDAVVKANEIAVRVQNETNAARGEGPTVCGHYNFWLEYGYLEQNRINDAKQVLEVCRRGAMASAASSGKVPDQGVLGYYAQMRSRFILDSGQWDGDVVHWAVPAGADTGTQLTFAFANGFAAVRRGDLQTAREDLAKVNELGNRVQGRGISATGAAPESAYTERATILSTQLQALLDQSAGNTDQAVALLRKAAASENSMSLEYGPPFIEKPTEELLGEVLLDAKQPSEATKAFQAALARAPKRTQSLLGLARASKASGDTQEAEETEATLHGIWHDSVRAGEASSGGPR
jgi:tetratricopeptide (TPR) repeat protein